MYLIDTHSHLFSLNSPTSEVLDRARENNVFSTICIGSSEGVKSAKEAFDISNNFENVFSTVGIHPHSADEFTELNELEKYMSNPKVVGVGECGLDFFRNWSSFDNQKTLFRNSISFSINHNKPIVIHCRDAKEQLLKILKELKAYKVGGVVHCFVEDSEFSKELEQIGFKISLTGIITFSKAEKLREEVKKIPLSQIMLETDCPYMAPTPFRGKPSEPMHVLQIAKKLSEIKDIPIEEIASTTTKNAIKLFNLPINFD